MGFGIVADFATSEKMRQPQLSKLQQLKFLVTNVCCKKWNGFGVIMSIPVHCATYRTHLKPDCPAHPNEKVRSKSLLEVSGSVWPCVATWGEDYGHHKIVCHVF